MRKHPRHQQDYYVFSRPNQMVGHRFTDDVAICKAISFQQAKKKFGKLYADVKDDEISIISGTFNDGTHGDVIILTDY